MPKIRPRVTIPCVADRYASPGERIVEIGFPARAGTDEEYVGGLISLRRHSITRRPIVELYRCEGIDVLAPGGDKIALDRIAELLSGREWNVGDLEAVAELVTRSGRTIAEPDDA